MGVTIKKTDNLVGVKEKAQIILHLLIMQDSKESYTKRKCSESWLRGACTVFRSLPNTENVIKHIYKSIQEVRYD